MLEESILISIGINFMNTRTQWLRLCHLLCVSSMDAVNTEYVHVGALSLTLETVTVTVPVPWANTKHIP